MTGLRIAQICGDRGIAPGSTKGAAQHLRGLASGFQVLGNEVRTFASRSADGPFPVTVEPLAELDRLEAGSIDVVYERYSLGHRAGLDLARRLDVPFVLEVNAPLVDEANRHRPGSVADDDAAIERSLLAAADLVITVSTGLTDWVAPHRSGPTLTLPNGFEPAWFPTRARTTEPRFPLVFLGHPKPWHGADRLIDLMIDLAAMGHRPDMLVIGGGSGAEALRAAAATAGVGERLHVTGALAPEQATLLLGECGIGLAPYRRQEPFYFCPLKVVDYLAAGLPVVATRQGDIPALVGDGGIVVDPDDDADLVAAVALLLESSSMRASMGASGRAGAWSTMTWDHVARRTIDAIERLLPVERPFEAVTR